MEYEPYLYQYLILEKKLLMYNAVDIVKYLYILKSIFVDNNSEK